MNNKNILHKKNKNYSSVHRRRSLIVVLSFVLLLLVVSGCSKAPSEVPADNNQEQLDIVDENPEQVQEELEDPSLTELDNIDLSDW